MRTARLVSYRGVQSYPSEQNRRFSPRVQVAHIDPGTASLAAATVGLFEDTIAALTLLAIYMPVVAGMGGNAGTPSMAVTIRGIALEQISLRRRIQANGR